MRWGAVLAAVLAAGCVTSGDADKQRMRDEAAMTRLEGDVVRLREQVQASGAGQQDVYRRVDAMQQTQDERMRQLESRLASLERAVQALDAARAADRKEIVDQLTGKISGIMRSQSSGGGAGSVTGVEHVVQPGQTLSQIAAAYGVKADAIIRANGLRDPNSIRAGQRLIIPD